jgi:antirestriction protein ArdC
MHITKTETAVVNSVYDRVTNQIIEAIEAGAGAGRYRMPWHITDAGAFQPLNAASKRAYRGVNVLSLWIAAARRGYSSGLWATYKQWQELGAQVRRGEQSTLVVFWKPVQAEGEKPESGKDEPRSGRRLIAKGYPIFNVAQVDGYTPPPVPSLSKSERSESGERFFAALQADIRHGGIEAFYDPQKDFIQMPRFEAFRDGLAYYATLAHEATHWTGALDRLNRNIENRFGSLAYAAEELIAELGAAFLCSALGIANRPRPDHANYIASWLELLRKDKRAIFTAASKAQEAIDWMQSRQDESPAVSVETGEELGA